MDVEGAFHRGRGGADEEGWNVVGLAIGWVGGSSLSVSASCPQDVQERESVGGVVVVLTVRGGKK